MSRLGSRYTQIRLIFSDMVWPQQRTGRSRRIRMEVRWYSHLLHMFLDTVIVDIGCGYLNPKMAAAWVVASGADLLSGNMSGADS
jgi:hypothetical protein